jgi:NAD(P)-dependent dehydrogenase (short-subunit alcohol dehydrogenase family)
MATNHLGHFLLTALLAPSFAPTARIVNTTSRGHMIAGINSHDPHFMTTPYDKWRAYGQSKTANILFTRGLAERGLDAYAVHPGAIDTGLTRHLEGEELEFVAHASAGESKTLQQGAATLLWAATSVGIPSGSYLADCQIAEAAGHATAPEAVEALWAWSEQEVRQAFPA